MFSIEPIYVYRSSDLRHHSDLNGNHMSELYSIGDQMKDRSDAWAHVYYMDHRNTVREWGWVAT